MLHQGLSRLRARHLAQHPRSQARDAVTVDFAKIKESRIGELSARFDIVLGFTPEA